MQKGTSRSTSAKKNGSVLTRECLEHAACQCARAAVAVGQHSAAVVAASDNGVGQRQAVLRGHHALILACKLADVVSGLEDRPVDRGDASLVGSPVLSGDKVQQALVLGGLCCWEEQTGRGGAAAVIEDQERRGV